LRATFTEWETLKIISKCNNKSLPLVYL